MKTTRPGFAAGFTLLELLVTALVMGTALVAASWSMSATARTQALHDQAESPALELAREIHELALALPKTPAGTTGVTDPELLVALDGLVDAVFDPAILANGSPAAGVSGWSQHVDLDVVSVAAPDIPTADDPAAGLPVDGSLLYRLRVEIRHDDAVADTFSWWINP